ncbi:MAG: SRPBCC family protein [Xanthomonadales bacterium]|nr:SRPBCC family protein [Xanthomonadales bacterium]
MRVLSEQIDINAPAELVWDVLANFGGVALWAPYMITSHLVGPQDSGPGTRRAMKHAWGFRFEEQVTEWNEGKGLSFDVHRAPFPMRAVQETWELSRRGERTVIATRVSYRMGLGILGGFLDWALVRFIVRREMRAGLRGFREYAENEASRTQAAQFAP